MKTVKRFFYTGIATICWSHVANEDTKEKTSQYYGLIIKGTFDHLAISMNGIGKQTANFKYYNIVCLVVCCLAVCVCMHIYIHTYIYYCV